MPLYCVLSSKILSLWNSTDLQHFLLDLCVSYLKGSLSGDSYITISKDEALLCSVSWMNFTNCLKNAVCYRQNACTWVTHSLECIVYNDFLQQIKFSLSERSYVSPIICPIKMCANKKRERQNFWRQTYRWRKVQSGWKRKPEENPKQRYIVQFGVLGGVGLACVLLT